MILANSDLVLTVTSWNSGKRQARLAGVSPIETMYWLYWSISWSIPLRTSAYLTS